MRRAIDVFVGETPLRVGTLRYNQQGARESAVFEYAASWLEHAERFVIDPLLPLQRGPQFRQRPRDGSVFHAAIADTEPDGWGRNVIRRDHAKRRVAARAQGNDLPPLENSLDFLLEVDDLSRVGALRFRDESGDFQRTTEPGRRAAPPLLELRQMIASSTAVELHAETAEDLAYLRGRGTSLGGLRPKCSVLDDDGHLAIGKFPSVRDERAVTRGEVLALHLALRAGIHAATARIVMSEDVPVALIRRFDRARGGRIPYVSAATLMGVEPSAEHTYVELVDAIRVHGAAVQDDLEELWRRIAFSVLITNVDDHLHNHGFLHVAHGTWRLSPAFDINPFPDRARELKTWISAETGPAATIEGLLSAAGHFGIPLPRARSIVHDVERAVRVWRSVGLEVGMTARELDAFADAFEHEEREVARKA
jgi:serine/threonine-protein kinase HipA